MHASQGPYQVEGGRPLNIRGRTGLAGRGVLGKYVQDIARFHYLIFSRIGGVPTMLQTRL